VVEGFLTREHAEKEGHFGMNPTADGDAHERYWNGEAGTEHFRTKG
jgi:hypothetical protein